MTGSHEVDGSIPFSSTKDIQGLFTSPTAGITPFYSLPMVRSAAELFALHFGVDNTPIIK